MGSTCSTSRLPRPRLSLPRTSSRIRTTWILPGPVQFGSGRLGFRLPGRRFRLRRLFSVQTTNLRLLRWRFQPRLGPRTLLRPAILRSFCPRRLGSLQHPSPLLGPRPSTQLPPQGALALLSRQLRPRRRRSRSPRPTRNPLRHSSLSSYRSRPSRGSLRTGPPRAPLRRTRKSPQPKLLLQLSSAWDLRTSAACSLA